MKVAVAHRALDGGQGTWALALARENGIISPSANISGFAHFGVPNLSQEVYK
jgi:tRNA A37 threonylcarbamoyladenosine synthetase subunit TsaC/SUA5/YrdC